MQQAAEKVFQVGSKWLRIDQTTVGWDNTLLTSIVKTPNQIRYSVNSIELEQWSIGTKYLIELRGDEGKTLSIPFKSYFGIGRKRKYEIFNEVIDVLMDYFFIDPWNQILERWADGETWSIGKYEMGPEGITKSYSDRAVFIAFDDMKALNRYDHVLINSISDHKKFMKLDFRQDWNWPLVNKMLMNLDIWN